MANVFSRVVVATVSFSNRVSSENKHLATLHSNSCSPLKNNKKTLMMLKNSMLLLQCNYFCMDSECTMTLGQFSFLSSMQMILFFNSLERKRGTKLIIMQLSCITAPLDSFYLG